MNMKTTDRYVLSVLLAGVVSACSAATIAHWTFGEHGLADKTGNGFDLSVGLGGLPDLGFANGCLQLNGAANVFYPNAFPAHAFSRSGLTYEFYFRTSTGRGANQFAMLFENSGSYWRYPGTMSARLHESDNRMLATALRTNSGYSSRHSDPGGADAPLTDGEWHHVALVYDPKATGASRCRSYLDGHEMASVEGEMQDDLQVLNGDCSIFLGGRAFDAGTFLVGEMDDVRIMPWALAPSEFQQTHALRTTLAHWKFDKAATALTDLSGHGYDLQNMNGVVFQNGAAVFNGENAHLITTNALAFSRSPQVTIEGRFWFEESQKLGVLFSSQHAGEVDLVGGFVVYGYLGSILSQLRVRPSTWQQCRMPNLAGALGGWHHVAYVVDMADATSGLASLWIDGVRQSCSLANASSAGALPDQIFSIGGGGSYSDDAWNNPNHHSTFKGRVAEMMITPVALGPSNFRLLTEPDSEALIERPEAAPRESMPFDLADLTDVTVECFAKFPSSGAEGEIVAFTPEGAPQFVVRVEDGVLAARVVPGAGVSNVETAAVPTDGQWHHLAFVVDGYATRASRVRLYVDRVRSTSHDTCANWSAPFRAGTLEFGAGFNGALDSIRVTKGVVPIAEFLGERRPESTRVVVRYS